MLEKVIIILALIDGIFVSLSSCSMKRLIFLGVISLITIGIILYIFKTSTNQFTLDLSLNIHIR